MVRNIRAVLFDAAGVIFPPSWRLSAVDRSGRAIRNDEIEAAFKRLYHLGDHPLCDWERGHLSFDTFRAAIARKSDADINWASLEMIVDPPTVFPETVAMMRRLRKNAYAVGVVTNVMHEFADVYDACSDLHDISDVWLRSCDIGYRKPEPEIFLEVMHRLGGLQPQECLFLDDNEVCIDGAARLGIKTIFVGEVRSAMREVDSLLQLSEG